LVASPEPGATVAVSGDFPDEYFIKLCSSLVPLGQQLEINGKLYVRTEADLVAKV
jgi:hypothetical protein